MQLFITVAEQERNSDLVEPFPELSRADRANYCLYRTPHAPRKLIITVACWYCGGGIVGARECVRYTRVDSRGKGANTRRDRLPRALLRVPYVQCFHDLFAVAIQSWLVKSSAPPARPIPPVPSRTRRRRQFAA